jgi:hypothetical protein
MRYYSFTHEPTSKELKELTDQHLHNYHDYCRVWYWDGRKESFNNDLPGVYYYEAEKIWNVYFYSSELESYPISFMGRGIIRTKRVVEKKA